MLRIAICDDSISDLSNMTSIINDYISLQSDKNCIAYTAFQSAVDLIAAMESGHQYNLVLLDVLMPFLTGIEAAKEIRQFNQDVKIIFLTSSSEFAVESYSVNAYYYALKPIWKEKLFLLLDKVIGELDVPAGASLLIKSKKGLTRIYISKLEYAEVIGRTILYHLINGLVVEAVGSMSELEKDLLANQTFIKPHRSYIINMEHIHTLSPTEIMMQSRTIIPIARANNRAVKSSYITFAFKEPMSYEDI